jgi:hypothetical protein
MPETFSPTATSHPQDSHRANLARRRGKKIMEIAAFVMIAGVVMGVLQQFDQNSW